MTDPRQPEGGAQPGPATAVHPGAVDDPRVTVVVVVYGEEPWLPRCVAAIAGSVGIRPEIVLVENGGSEDVIAALEADGTVTVVRPGRNTGFAEGCDVGAAAGDAPFVALVNPDAIVEPQALAALVTVAAEPTVGLATGSIRLADRPELLNSAGNDINFLGLSWSGCFEEEAAAHATIHDVAAASGAGMACRREVWEALGGLVPELFAYYEDAELSVRTWQRGLRVVYVPDGVVVHRYEFSRNTSKFFLLERNRLVMVLTCFGPRQLAAIAPMAVPLELGLLAMGARDGWLREKLRAYAWLVRNRAWLRARRRKVQGERLTDESVVAALLTTSLQPGNLPGAHPPAAVERLVDGYWRIARRLARLT